MKGIYLHILAGLAQQIATSPTLMADCPVQPRVGTQKCENNKTIRDIDLKF